VARCLAVKQEKLMDLIRHQSMVAREDKMKEEEPLDTALLLRFAERARGHGFMVDAIRLYQAGGGLSDDAIKELNGIGDDGLSSLLICGLPREDQRYAGDVADIARDAGVDPAWLADVIRRYDPRKIGCRMCAGRAVGVRSCPVCEASVCGTCWPEEGPSWAVAAGSYDCPNCGVLELRASGHGLVYEWPPVLDGPPPLPVGARDWLRYRDDPASCVAAGGNRCVAYAVAAHRQTVAQGDGFPRGGFVIDWLADASDIAGWIPR